MSSDLIVISVRRGMSDDWIVSQESRIHGSFSSYDFALHSATELAAALADSGKYVEIRPETEAT
ncbi:hypothetical protein GJW-30_1_01703 [Variibacter gotjawalensis]|uniref:Uncharacterized protein n=1 Tax=Variibacter gotjawalensis TaxID=1333996 RepID=A0A0S3PT87_9BRAD|nr:hypothetical protein [Variibacter gotjawalensis]NIK49488.1 hypothetical protein [Variibacter gotjawalensis]RZS51340.1 hypothetical protein EV661_3818 [Variibacter gotjawalensis]BAT59173.1 hypothetical protein GJW-30_1_01703 [Variibacter gotjawalensis]